MSSVKMIGQKIQYARQLRELDRTGFARLIEVKYRDVLRWETTSHEPRAATIKKMADVLNIDVNYFLDDKIGPSAIAFYLPEEEMLRETGFGEIYAFNRKQLRECIEPVEDFHLLKTICRLMMDYVDAKLLPYLSDVIFEFTKYSGDVPEKLDSDYERRLFIKQMISYIDDPDLLKSTGRVLITFTRNADLNKQLATVMTLTNTFPKVVFPGK